MTWPGERSLTGGIDRLAIGSADIGGGGIDGGGAAVWMCGKHAVAPDPLAVLTRTASATIVCLTERHEVDQRYPSYVDWLDAQSGDQALWHPIPDLDAPQLDVFVALLHQIERRLTNGNVVIHCAAGYGRTGTVAAGLLVRSGASFEHALAAVRASRPLAGPESGTQRDLVRALSETIAR